MTGGPVGVGVIGAGVISSHLDDLTRFGRDAGSLVAAVELPVRTAAERKALLAIT